MMFTSIASIMLALVNNTHIAWCLHCRKHQKAKTVRNVEVQNPKRISRRLVGQCKACSSATSTIVA